MLKTQETRLVDFLSNIDKSHIDELIDLLTDFGSGRIALNSTVKDVLLNEKELSLCNTYSKEFIELIITEFQLYAGNSLINLIRKNLVSYEETLNYVYTILCDNSNQHSIQEKENYILKELLGNEIENSTFEYRLKKGQDKGKILKANIKNGFLSRIIAKSPNNYAGIISSFSSESYRIMIPFILQISWLKMKYGFYASTHPIKVNNKSQMPCYSIHHKKKVNKESISGLNHLLNTVPDLLIIKELSGNSYAKINVPLEKLANAKDGDGLRAIILGNKGISENARIYSPEKLQNLVNSGMLFNLASTLVAQKHLADINEKLDEINNNLKDIKEWLQDERKAKITSAYKESCGVYNYHLVKGEKISAKEENLLVNHLKDVQQVYTHIQSDLRKVCENIKKCDKIQSKKLLDLLKNYNSAYEELKLCCNAILSIYAIFFLSNKEQINLEKMKGLQLETNSILTERTSVITQHLDSLLKESESIFNFNSTELANRAFVYNRAFDLNSNISHSLKKMELFYNSFLIEDKSIDIYVSLENGLIKEAIL